MCKSAKFRWNSLSQAENSGERKVATGPNGQRRRRTVSKSRALDNFKLSIEELRVYYLRVTTSLALATNLSILSVACQFAINGD